MRSKPNLECWLQLLCSYLYEKLEYGLRQYINTPHRAGNAVAPFGNRLKEGCTSSVMSKESPPTEKLAFKSITTTESLWGTGVSLYSCLFNTDSLYSSSLISLLRKCGLLALSSFLSSINVAIDVYTIAYNMGCNTLSNRYTFAANNQISCINSVDKLFLH